MGGWVGGGRDLQSGRAGGRVGGCLRDAENQCLVRGRVPGGERAVVMPVWEERWVGGLSRRRSWVD